MPPTVAPVQLTDQAGVQQVFGRTGVNIRLDADRTTVVTATEQLVLTFCLNYGSEFVWAKCGKRYSLPTLQASWLAYWWASVIAAHKFAQFRQGAPPAALQAEYEETYTLLREIADGVFLPASMASLSGSGAAIDNVRLDPRFRIKQMRVEQTISDGPDQKSPVRREILSQFVFERDN